MEPILAGNRTSTERITGPAALPVCGCKTDQGRGSEFRLTGESDGDPGDHDLVEVIEPAGSDPSRLQLAPWRVQGPWVEGAGSAQQPLSVAITTARSCPGSPAVQAA